MDFRKLVRKARTCRRFTRKKVSRKTLEKLVACARLTPSGKNQQVVRFALVTERDAVSSLAKCHHWASALKWDGPAESEYPAAYIVLYLPKEALPLAVIDLGICAQTINLAAASTGLKTCMVASFKPETVEEVVRTPDGLQVRLLMAIGVPGEKQEIRKMAEGVDYWREGELHCVPKRSLDELIVARL